MLIIKADGTKEEFSEDKIISSIKRAGIPQDLQQNVLEHVKSKLYDKIPTSEIYRHIIEFLGSSNQPFHKSRFSIKKALMDLGPTGHPFEDYLGRLLHHLGFQTQIRVMIQGKCIQHEIDVIASKDNEKIMIEAKFHNNNSTKTDTHVGLYTQARFEDVKDKNNFTSAWLITNTKATSEVITYAQCVGLGLLGWSYPENDGLRDLVEKYQLFPVTTLSELTSTQQQQLLFQGVILCKDICSKPESLDMINLPDNKKQQILKEASFVCSLDKS